MAWVEELETWSVTFMIVLIGTPSVYEDYIWRKLKSAHAALLSCEHSTRTPSEPFGNKKLLL